MSRLQTKCVMASAAAHGLLLAILVVGSAFVKPPAREEKIIPIRLIPNAKITDEETQGGGNPNVPSDATPPPTQLVAPPQQPVVNQEPPIQLEPPPKPKTPEVKKKKVVELAPEKKETKKPETKPEKVETAKVLKRDNSKKIVPRKDLTEKPPETLKDKPKIDVDLNVKKAAPDPNIERERLERKRQAKEQKEREEAAERARQDAIDRANKQYKETQTALGSIVGNVSTGLARTTNVEMPGPGGEAFINYADLLYTRYYQAWQTPDGRDSRNPVKVEIVVARDGRVISSNIIRPSGDSQLDRSVRQALERVTKLPAFPEGAKDAQRTFRINFELKSKRQFG